MEHPPLPIRNLRMGEVIVGFFLFKLLNKVFWVTPSPNPQLGCFVYETIVVKSVIYLLDRNNPRAVLPKLGWVCSGLGFFFHLHVCYMRIYIGFLTLLGSFSLVCCCYKLKKKQIDFMQPQFSIITKIREKNCILRKQMQVWMPKDSLCFFLYQY